MNVSKLVLVVLGLLVLVSCASDPEPKKNISSMGKEDASWQKFQAEKSGKSMDADMEEYRALKNEEK